MKALVYDQAGVASVREVPYPKCGDDQIIIKVEACGICKWVEIGHSTTGTKLSKYPTTPGHEFAGYVHEIGKNVSNFKVGDRVTADNTVLCQDCYFCRRNQPLYCQNFGSLGHNIAGGFAEYVVVNKDKVYRIADHISFDEASITEPVACCIHAMDILDVKCGENVLVLGTGPHGLILSQLEKHSKAVGLAVIGSMENKLSILNEYDIKTIKMDRADFSVHEKQVMEMFPRGVDAIIDTTSSAELVFNSFKLLKKGGRLLQYGGFHDEQKVVLDSEFLNDFHFGELKYISTAAQTHCYDHALAFMETGKVKLDKLVTHVFKLDDYFKALEVAQHDRSAIKVVIHPN